MCENNGIALGPQIVIRFFKNVTVFNETNQRCEGNFVRH